MNQTQHASRALFQKVGVQAMGLEKANAVGEFGPLGDGFVVLKLGDLDLLAELQPSDQPTIALDDVVGKIAKKGNSRDGTYDVMGAAPDFAEKIHGRRESQDAPPVNRKNALESGI